MAVKARNVGNAKKAQMWDERDDAALLTLLKRKIKDTNIALRECETPYERDRLKAARNRYKSMLRKVESGSYNGDIIFNELKASAALRQEQNLSTRAYSSVKAGKKYNDSYNTAEFDYESAFRKTRYYGFALPIMMTVLSVLLIASFVIGFVLPAETAEKVEEYLPLNFHAYFVYRLGPTEDGEIRDLTINNIEEGESWPYAYYQDLENPDLFPASYWTKGTLTESEDDEEEEFYPFEPEDGVPYEDANGKIPKTVRLFADCHVTAVYIDSADILKAWFKTKMLKNVRLDFLEDLEYFQGDSYFYELFLSGTKADDLVIQKNEAGNYDFGTIYNHIGVYGTILFLIATFLMSVVLLILNIIRIFTYTSRRLHGTTLVTMLMAFFAMISPALASCDGTQLGTALSNYFSSLNGMETFVSNLGAQAGITIVYLVPLGIAAVMLVMPFLFKNRFKKLPTRLPKGNKIHDPFNRSKT